MANRSTRNKLRFQADKVLTATKRVFEHLQYLDELAEGKSEYITKYLTFFASSLAEWETGFQRFKEGL